MNSSETEQVNNDTGADQCRKQSKKHCEADEATVKCSVTDWPPTHTNTHKYSFKHSSGRSGETCWGKWQGTETLFHSKTMQTKCVISSYAGVSPVSVCSVMTCQDLSVWPEKRLKGEQNFKDKRKNNPFEERLCKCVYVDINLSKMPQAIIEKELLFENVQTLISIEWVEMWRLQNFPTLNVLNTNSK